MPNLHLTKVAVGCASLEALQNRVARRVSHGVVRVPTRMRPKRMEELVGGSAAAHQQKLASAMLSGIQQYFEASPALAARTG